jgi:hypothetical protein
MEKVDTNLQYYNPEFYKTKTKKKEKKQKVVETENYGLKFINKIDGIDKNIKLKVLKMQREMDVFLKLIFPKKLQKDFYDDFQDIDLSKIYSNVVNLVEDIYLTKPTTDFECIFNTLKSDYQLTIKNVAYSILKSVKCPTSLKHVMEFCEKEYNGELMIPFAVLVRYQYVYKFITEVISEEDLKELTGAQNRIRESESEIKNIVKDVK